MQLDNFSTDTALLMIFGESVQRLPESLAGRAPFLTLMHEKILQPTINRKLLDEVRQPLRISKYLSELSQWYSKPHIDGNIEVLWSVAKFLCQNGPTNFSKLMDTFVVEEPKYFKIQSGDGTS